MLNWNVGIANRSTVKFFQDTFVEPKSVLGYLLLSQTCYLIKCHGVDVMNLCTKLYFSLPVSKCEE